MRVLAEEDLLFDASVGVTSKYLAKRCALFLISPMIILLGLLLAMNSSAAEFKRLCDLEDKRDMQCTISMSGPIKAGDAARLVKVLTSDPFRRGGDRFLLLSSLGGDVEEAMRIGEVVKSAMLITTLVRVADIDNEHEHVRRRCASACFLVFLAGAERKPLWGDLGIHRPYFGSEYYRDRSPLDIAKAQEKLEMAVRRYAQAHGVSDVLLEKMMSHSSRDVYWLQPSEKEALQGEQSWFQEIMIASCKWDPVREKNLYARWMNGEPKDPRDSEWLSASYACINGRIEAAQIALTPR